MTKEVFWLRAGCVSLLVAFALHTLTAHTAERGTPTTGAAYDLIRSGQFVQRGLPSLQACDEALVSQRALYAAKKTSGSERWVCREDRWTNVSYGPNPSCPSPPAPRTQNCPTGYNGSWTQTATVGSAPTCAVSWSPTTAPTGSCVPVPPPTPSGTATLTWTHSGLNTRGFRVRFGRSQTSMAGFSILPSASARTATITELAPGTYYFTVEAMGICTGTQGSPLDPWRCEEDSVPSNMVSKVVQ